MIQAIVITLLWFPLVGAALSRAGLRGAAGWYLRGVGACGFALFASGVLGIPMLWMIPFITIAAGIAVLVAPSPEARRGEERYPLLATLLLCLPLIIFLAVSLIVPLADYDGRVFWILKAKAIFWDLGLDGPFFRGEGSFNPRNAYPLLLPLDAAAVMLMSGSMDDMQIRWLYAGILIAFAFLLRSELGKLTSPAIGAWCAALLVWLPRFGVHWESGALTAYADIAIAAFSTFALLELLGQADPLRFALWTSFLAMTKNEGLPLSLILWMAAIAVWISDAQARRWRRLLAGTALFTVALGTVFAWRKRVPLSDEQDFISQLVALPEKLDRLVPATGRTLSHLFTFNEWGLFWPAVLVATIVLIRRREWRTLAICAWFFFAFGAMYVAVFVTTVWEMMPLIDQATPRLLMHFVGPGMVLLAMSVKPYTLQTET